nr:hypothetical protein [Candidatus Uhrbacteria bacterium]
GTSSIGGTTSIGGSSAEGGTVSAGGTSSIGGSSSAGGGTSLGCSVTGQQTGEFHLSVKDGAGTDRDFLVIVPTLYVPNIPRSLLFGFHGAGGTYDTPRYYGFLEVPDAVADTIYIFPQGVPYRDYGVGWNDACDGYDMVFFDNMLAKIESLYCIDTKRVYAVGFSWGCDFVTGLACCRGDKIRGIGAASCSDDFSRSGDFTSYLYLPCPAVSHAGIRFTHDLNGDWGYSADQMTMTSRLYRYLNRCSENSSAISTECVSYNDCAEPVVECDYPGLGHWMPPNWAQDTWNFFKQLP